MYGSVTAATGIQLFTVCEGEYAGNVTVLGLLLPPGGKGSSLICKSLLWEHVHFVHEEFIEELQRVHAQHKPGRQYASSCVLFSCGCSKKLLQVWWLKTAEIPSLTVLERNKEAQNQSIRTTLPKEAPGNSLFLPLAASGGYQVSLTHGCITPIPAFVVTLPPLLLCAFSSLCLS